MKGKTHCLCGICLGLALTPTLIHYDVCQDLPYVGGMLAGTVLGSLLPDIDHPNSVIRRRMRKIVLGYENKNVEKVKGGFWGHRGMTHTLLFWLLLYLVFSMFGWINVFTIGIFIGAVCHLFADCLNPSGAPVFWPIQDMLCQKNKRNYFKGWISRISIAKIQTSGTGESIFAIFMFFVLIFECYYAYHSWFGIMLRNIISF